MSASEQIINKSRKTVTITDSLGRSIVIRKPNRWEERCYRAALPETESINGGVYASDYPALFAVSIDNDLLLPPDSLKNIESRYNDLGDEGFEAIEQAIATEFPEVIKKKDESQEAPEKK